MYRRQSSRGTVPVSACVQCKVPNFTHRGTIMNISNNSPIKSSRKLLLGVATIAVMLGLGGCAGMSHQDKSTAAGAGIGAVGGAVLTGGSALGTVGGAAVGGIIGHEVGK